MLIQLPPEPHDDERVHRIQTFAHLYAHTLVLLAEASRTKKITMVLGPMAPQENESITLEQNLEVLYQKSISLVATGRYSVIEFSSFQSKVDELIAKLNVVGYPYPVLDDFILPLIRSGWFEVLFFRFGWENAFGSSREHEVATESGIVIEYFD